MWHSLSETRLRQVSRNNCAVKNLDLSSFRTFLLDFYELNQN
jgi:hypothetical protein